MRLGQPGFPPPPPHTRTCTSSKSKLCYATSYRHATPPPTPPQAAGRTRPSTHTPPAAAPRRTCEHVGGGGGDGGGRSGGGRVSQPLAAVTRTPHPRPVWTLPLALCTPPHTHTWTCTRTHPQCLWKKSVRRPARRMAARCAAGSTDRRTRLGPHTAPGMCARVCVWRGGGAEGEGRGRGGRWAVRQRAEATQRRGRRRPGGEDNRWCGRAAGLSWSRDTDSCCHAQATYPRA